MTLKATFMFCLKSKTYNIMKMDISSEMFHDLKGH